MKCYGHPRGQRPRPACKDTTTLISEAAHLQSLQGTRRAGTPQRKQELGGRKHLHCLACVSTWTGGAEASSAVEGLAGWAETPREGRGHTLGAEAEA